MRTSWLATHPHAALHERAAAAVVRDAFDPLQVVVGPVDVAVGEVEGERERADELRAVDGEHVDASRPVEGARLQPRDVEQRRVEEHPA